MTGCCEFEKAADEFIFVLRLLDDEPFSSELFLDSDAEELDERDPFIEV